MANFAAVAHLDTFELAGSLRTRWGLFRPPGKGIPSLRELQACGIRELRVRGVKASGPDPEFSDPEFVRYKSAANWVELANLRSEIARRAETLIPPGIEFGEIFFEMLDAGAMLNWIAEDEPYFERYTRAILPLRTNPGVLLIYGNETASPGAGWLTAVNPRLPHAAINMGDAPAVWLVLDFKRKVADG